MEAEYPLKGFFLYLSARPKGIPHPYHLIFPWIVFKLGRIIPLVHDLEFTRIIRISFLLILVSRNSCLARTADLCQYKTSPRLWRNPRICLSIFKLPPHPNSPQSQIKLLSPNIIRHCYLFVDSLTRLALKPDRYNGSSTK